MGYTSIANPAKVTGEYIGQKYIKITHELELKKLSFLLLAPVFELGFVVRDRYVTQTGRNEFLTLEAVVPPKCHFSLEVFYKTIANKAIQIAHELNLEYNTDFDSIEIVDVRQEYNNTFSIFTKESFIQYYNDIKDNYTNVIMLNAPSDSPLGLRDDNEICYETQWNYRSHGIGHGYDDEYRTKILKQGFVKQQMFLRQKGIVAELPEDFLHYCEYSSIPTFSFNMGVERFFENFFSII